MKNIKLIKTEKKNISQNNINFANWFYDIWIESGKPKIDFSFLDEIDKEYQEKFVTFCDLTDNQYELLCSQKNYNHVFVTYNHCINLTTFLKYDIDKNELKIINQTGNIKEDLFSSLIEKVDDKTYIHIDNLEKIISQTSYNMKNWISNIASSKFKKAFYHISFWQAGLKNKNKASEYTNPRAMFLTLINFDAQKWNNSKPKIKYFEDEYNKYLANKSELNKSQYFSILRIWSILNIYNPKTNKLELENIHFSHNTVPPKLLFPIEIPLKSLPYDTNDINNVINKLNEKYLPINTKEKEDLFWNNINPIFNGIQPSILQEGLSSIKFALSKGATVEQIQKYWVINRIKGLPESQCYIPLPDGSKIKSNTKYSLNLIPYSWAPKGYSDLEEVDKNFNKKNYEFSTSIKKNILLKNEITSQSVSRHFESSSNENRQAFIFNAPTSSENLPEGININDIKDKFLLFINCNNVEDQDDIKNKINCYLKNYYKDSNLFFMDCCNTQEFNNNYQPNWSFIFPDWLEKNVKIYELYNSGKLSKEECLDVIKQPNFDVIKSNHQKIKELSKFSQFVPKQKSKKNKLKDN